MDELTDFLLPEHGVRGAIVGIGAGIGQMFDHRAYPPPVRALLGQACAAAPLLASHGKFDGRINLQFQGKGAIKLMVVQIDRELRVRGMAKADAQAQGSFQELLGGGLLALMLEPRPGLQPYQATVDVRGETLAQALEGYFAQSEQLPTRLLLAASGERLAGLLLQRLPEKSTDVSWEHVTTLFDTLGETELAATDPLTVLRRLFHAEDLRVFVPQAVRLACSCSHASISGMLAALGEAELRPLVEERGSVEVTCEFCGREYRYNRVELDTLFAGLRADGGTSRH